MMLSTAVVRSRLGLPRGVSTKIFSPRLLLALRVPSSSESLACWLLLRLSIPSGPAHGLDPVANTGDLFRGFSRTTSSCDHLLHTIASPCLHAIIHAESLILSISFHASPLPSIPTCFLLWGCGGGCRSILRFLPQMFRNLCRLLRSCKDCGVTSAMVAADAAVVPVAE